MKYKKLTQEQIIISLDRLTRFKNTKEKYIRVFSDIILSNLIEPKYKKNDVLNLSPQNLKDLAEEIFNGSLEIKTTDFSIFITLYDYENSIFVNDDYTKILLDNRLNYFEALNFLKKEIPVNLKWLQSLIILNKSGNLIILNIQ